MTFDLPPEPPVFFRGACAAEPLSKVKQGHFHLGPGITRLGEYSSGQNYKLLGASSLSFYYSIEPLQIHSIIIFHTCHQRDTRITLSVSTPGDSGDSLSVRHSLCLLVVGSRWQLDTPDSQTCKSP